MERLSGIFWRAACKPLNTVWLIIPDSQGNSDCIVYYPRTTHSLWLKKTAVARWRYRKHTQERGYVHTHTSTHTHRHTHPTLTGELSLKLTSRKMSQAQSPSQRWQRRWETCKEIRCPIMLTLIRPVPETPPTQILTPPHHPSVFSLIVCGKRCSTMQLKHTRGWKPRLSFWNVPPLSAE